MPARDLTVKEKREISQIAIIFRGICWNSFGFCSFGCSQGLIFFRFISLCFRWRRGGFFSSGTISLQFGDSMGYGGEGGKGFPQEEWVDKHGTMLMEDLEVVVLPMEQEAVGEVVEVILGGVAEITL